MAENKIRKPIKMVFDREEDTQFSVKRHPSKCIYKTAVKDGKITGVYGHIYYNCGAYLSSSYVVLQRGVFHGNGVYTFDNTYLKGEGIGTNMFPSCAFRGFGAPQAISMVRYDAGRYRTRIVQPDSLTLTSVLAEAEGAVAAVNAGYFNVKTLVPSTFVRVGGRTVAATEAREEFRVNGVVAIKGRRVRIEPYVPADDARLARRYRDALAAGPLLLCRGEALSYADREGGFWGRHPRSVVGITRRGEAVMIVVDGRFPVKIRSRFSLR